MLKRIEEINIPDENPFQNDRLDRETVANNLTTLLENTTTPYVMSVSAPWGQGKTTFIRMWRKLLRKRGFATVYFDAWSSDYADDPLLAFISAIDAEVTENENNDAALKAMETVKSTLKKVVRASPKIALNWALRGGLHFVTDGDDNAENEIDAITAIGAELVEREMAQLSTTRQTLDDFSKKLSDLGEIMGKEGKPLIIFVDELDRARPDYSVELLERIKHLFAVENILVILSVDTEKLGHAASQVIGFTPDHADGYLRRFIDLDYRLPEPNLTGLIQSHLDTHDLPNGYKFHYVADWLSSLAKLRGLSARDCLLIVHRHVATVRSLPDNLLDVIKSFLPIAILEAYCDSDSFGRVMSDPDHASQRLDELKGWRDVVDKDKDCELWWTRNRIFLLYAEWLIDLESNVLTEEEQGEVLRRARGQFERDNSKLRQKLLKMIAHAESFS